MPSRSQIMTVMFSVATIAVLMRVPQARQLIVGQ